MSTNVPIGTGNSGAKRSASSLAALTLFSSWIHSVLSGAVAASTTFGVTPCMTTALRASGGPYTSGLPWVSRSS